MLNQSLKVLIRASAVFTVTVGLSACGMGAPAVRQANGALAECSKAPHCVSSLSKDADHAVRPFTYTGSPQGAQTRLVSVIAGMPNTAMVDQKSDYLHATFTTGIMRYADDVEFWFPAAEPGVIHVRSSSRIGYYDFGTNHDRVEAIRAAYARQP